MNEDMFSGCVEIAGPVWTDMEMRLNAWLGSGRVCGVTLFHNVPAAHLTPGKRSGVVKVETADCLDHVVCQGDKVVLAAVESGASFSRQEDQRRVCGELGIPCVLLPGLRRGRREDGVTACLEGFVGEALAKGTEDNGEYRVRGLPPEYLPALAAGRMVVSAGRCGYITRYGSELGLSYGARQVDGGLGCRSAWVCEAGRYPRMLKILSGQGVEVREGPEGIALADRLAGLRRGESSDPRCMMERVRRFGSVPVGEWMKDSPDDLKELTGAGIRPEDTYCAAAAFIDKLLMDPKTRRRGRRLLLDLTEPFRAMAGGTRRT